MAAPSVRRAFARDAVRGHRRAHLCASGSARSGSISAVAALTRIAEGSLRRGASRRWPDPARHAERRRGAPSARATMRCWMNSQRRSKPLILRAGAPGEMPHGGGRTSPPGREPWRYASRHQPAQLQNGAWRSISRESPARFETRFDPAVSNPASPDELTPLAGFFFVAWLEGGPAGCGGTQSARWRHGRNQADVDGARSARARDRASDVAGARGEGRQARPTDRQLETNRTLSEAQALSRKDGYEEVAPFNAEPYAHDWFEKRL